MIASFRRSLVSSSLLLLFAACGGSIASEQAHNGAPTPPSSADAGEVDPSADAVVDASVGDVRAPDVTPPSPGAPDSPDAGNVKLVTAITAVSFDTIAVGARQGPYRITVTNLGSAVSPPIVAVLDGAGAFVVESDECTNAALPPGEQCTVHIVYAPSTEGAHEGTWSVVGQPFAHVTLTGEAYTPGVLSASTTLVDFGDHLLNIPVDPQSFTVTNAGPGPATGMKTSVEGADAAAFLGGSCAATLAPGASCTVDVYYFPDRRGVESAEVVVASDGRAPLRVPVRGRGLALAHFSAAASVDFGDVAVGASTWRDVTITNDGDTQSGAALPVVQGDTGFRIKQNGCSYLAGGASCTITVAAEPRSAGPMEATLHANIIGIGANDVDVKLTARAVAAP